MPRQVVYPGRVIGQCVCMSLICQKMMPETYRYAIDRFAVKSRLYKFSLSLCHKKASYNKNHHMSFVMPLIVGGNRGNVKRENKKGFRVRG